MIFLVENKSGLTHTFIREDIAKFNEPTIYDLVDVDLRIATLFRKPGSIILVMPWVMWMCLRLKNRLQLLKAVWLYLELLDVLKKHGDIKIRVHFLAKSALVAKMLSIRLGRRVSYEIVLHGSDLYSRGRSLLSVLKGSAKLECVTIYGHGFVSGLLGDVTKGSVVRNNVSGRFDISPVLRQDKSLIFVGRLVDQKDVFFALRVFEKLRAQNSDIIYFHIVGTGYLLNDLKVFVSKSKYLSSENVIFHGAVENKIVADLISDSWGLIIPCSDKVLANTDGLPVVFQEALRLGRPVFTRKILGVYEFVIDGFNGLSFDRHACANTWADKIDGFNYSPEEINMVSKFQF